jgi:hypothetical protein
MRKVGDIFKNGISGARKSGKIGCVIKIALGKAEKSVI